MTTEQTQHLLAQDSLPLLKEHMSDLLEECEMIGINSPTDSAKDFILTELETLQSQAITANAPTVILALEEIIELFSKDLKDFDSIIHTSQTGRITQKIGIKLDEVQTRFNKLFNFTGGTYGSIKADLDIIYKGIYQDTKELELTLLQKALDVGSRTYTGLILTELGLGKENTKLSESDMFILFLQTMDVDNAGGFKILFENPHLFKVFEANSVELVKRCVEYDAPKICSFLLERNKQVYEIFNAEKIAKLIHDTGSLLHLESVFTTNEIVTIYTRYGLEQFTKEGHIFWEESGKTACASREEVSAHILAKEAEYKEVAARDYREFIVRKKVCNINKMAKEAAKHDSPKTLKVLMAHDEYDEAEMPPEQLAAWAAWDNAASSLEMLILPLGVALNTVYAGEKPHILTLAEIAIKEHADKTLEVILAHISFSLAWVHDELEGPVLFGLALTGIKNKSIKCLDMLFEREEYSFEEQTKSAFEAMLQIHKKLSTKPNQTSSCKKLSYESEEDSGWEGSEPGSPPHNSGKDFLFAPQIVTGGLDIQDCGMQALGDNGWTTEVC